MRSKLILLSVLATSSLGLVACGGGGSSTVTETVPASTEGEQGTEAEAEGAATEPTESEPAPSGQARKAEKVEIVEFTYGPDPVVVQVGGKVTWKNEDTAPHTATADDGSFETGVIERGKTKSETFREPGTFTYHCKIHPQMHGTVEVVEKE